MGIFGKFIAGVLIGGGAAGAYNLGKSSAENNDFESEPQNLNATPQTQQTPLNSEFSAQEEKPVYRYSNTTLDDKLERGEKLTPLEARMYKQAGINVAEFGDQTYNVDMKARLNTKKDFNTLSSLKSANYLLDEAISKSNENLGLSGAADRAMHHATGKLWNMSDKNAEFEILHQNAVKAFGRSQKGGRLSNQDERQLEKYYGLGAVRDNYYEKVFVIKQKLVEDMYQELNALQKQGQRISDDDIKEYELARQSLIEMKKQINALNSGKQNKFDYKSWNARFLGKDRRADNFGSNSVQTAQSYNQTPNSQSGFRMIRATRNTQTPQKQGVQSTAQMSVFKGFSD